ncbi:GNAT family N-acetyltransferase [Nocardioides speluncae]|uniref:GNAT family N-acetyltransferase n=1 Tax=Nocardioides speluncae TaxID=2670337 RepID=UPI000D692ADD|nr:N-acetyltransferase [Nocardioides speluncae]
MQIRQESPDDVAAIRAVTAAAFAGMAHSMPPVDPDGVPGEASLVGWLRESAGWIPELSLVAEAGGQIVGHAVATRGTVDGEPALGLGPVSVAPDRQGGGVGSALVRGVIAAADELGEPLMVLLGEPAYYSRFGFRPATELGIASPDPEWGDYFQARPLAAYDPALTGTFRYAEPFTRA